MFGENLSLSLKIKDWRNPVFLNSGVCDPTCNLLELDCREYNRVGEIKRKNSVIMLK